MEKKIRVPINVPYLLEFVEKSGMSRNEYSAKVLLRSEAFISKLIYSGETNRSAAEAIIRATGADRERMLQKVDYNPEDFRLKASRYGEKDTEKDGTIAQYIALMSDGLIEIAKNQQQLCELMTLAGKLNADSKQYNAETNKLFEQLFRQVNDIGRKVDVIYKQLK